MNQATNAELGESRRQAQSDFQLGLAFLHKKQWKTAERHFRRADDRCSPEDQQANLYRSYHGLALVRCGHLSGLKLCRNAASLEKSRAVVFYNLALVEIRLNHRRSACEAIAAGLAIDPHDPSLLKMRNRLGVRRKPLLSFLKRDNPVNKWLGKATYRVKRRRSASR